MKGYDVLETFMDEGVSGGMIQRPGMQSMLSFIKKHKDGQIAVIIDDISRLARGLEAHLELRTSIAEVGGKLESPSIEFGDDSDSVLVENLLASVSQHQRQKNAEQVTNRMRARAMNGYAVASRYVGYKYEAVHGQGRMLIKDEPVASIVKAALEGFSNHRFETQVEVARFLQSHSEFPKNKDGSIHFDRVRRMIEQPIYAGYIDMPDWNVNFVQGKHEPLISLATWKRNQERLNETAKAPKRHDIREDFPLRGLVACAHCHRPFTANWSKGNLRSYAYYICQTKGCSALKKSIPKSELEGRFDAVLAGLKPNMGVFRMLTDMFKDAWEAGRKQMAVEAAALKRQQAEVEVRVAQLVDKMVETDSPTLLAAYEDRIKKLELDKALMAEKIAECGRPLRGFEETYRTSLEFISNPYKLWESDELDDKRMLLRLAFASPVEYCKNEGYRTPLTSLPFRVFGGKEVVDEKMVGVTGLEPVTSTMSR